MAANHNAHHAPVPVGGNLFNATTFVCGVLIAIMIAILAVRFHLRPRRGHQPQ